MTSKVSGCIVKGYFCILALSLVCLSVLYFTKSGEILVEIPTGEELGSKESFVSYANDIDANAERATMRRNAALPDTKSAHYISGTVPNYDHNPDGICGSTAAAMLLRWYDLYQNNNYVPSSLESANGVVLIEHLRSYIDGDNPGSDPGDVYFGILDYCADQGVSHAGGIENYSDAYVMGRVDTYEIPFLVCTLNHPKYGNHWVTGYGYNYSNGTCYPIVNDGWGNKGIAINPIFLRQIVW